MTGASSQPPRIGLSTYVEDARWGVWHEGAALLPASYVRVVAAAGGLPVMLPPIVPVDVESSVAAALGGIDGLVLTGGPDVDPARYGEAPHPETDVPRGERDRWELDLVRAALAVDLPVLAVCRGAQLLNVALGGSLHQHLPHVVGSAVHRPELGTYGSIAVRVEPASRLASIVGDGPEVSCHHHQAIDRVGAGLAVSARAPDGTIEAVEVTGARFAVGVQWHPEEQGDERLFVALVDAARRAT